MLADYYNQQNEALPTIMHWSDAGAASWYDVAVAVGELGQELGPFAVVRK